MIKCSVLYNDNNYYTEYAYTTEEFIKYALREEHNLTKKGYIEDVICTFDIETSTIKDLKSRKESVETYTGFMYHFQFCINGIVIFGRTWEQFTGFIGFLVDYFQLNKDRKLVIYVHNLSYEFQFIYDFIEFSDIFATEKRKVLRCSNDYFEFRCSYRLSNMSLGKFIQNTKNTTHAKGVDDLDYRTVRTCQTVLTEKEYGYCYNDVFGLYECIKERLKEDDYDTIPYTSTGYIRRMARKESKKEKSFRKLFNKMKLDYDQYVLCKKCFRGGNTASSRFMTDIIIDDVNSYDESSSYPYVIVASPEFPMGKFQWGFIEEEEELYYYNGKFATIGTYSFKNIRLKDNVPIPYIPYSKCEELGNSKYYNGRILKADILTLSLTNIDFEIINKQYDYDDIYVSDFYYARKGLLPKWLRDFVFNLYKEKSHLKVECAKNHDDENLPYLYMKKKNEVNSCFGMMVTDIVHQDITINEGEWIEREVTGKDAIEKALNDFYKNRNSFLCYQWGIFVTAIARKQLQKSIDKIGLDVVYVDTDSNKHIGNHDDDIEEINKEIRQQAIENNVEISCIVDGHEFTLGVYEQEKPYDKFITIGAKKYAYDQKGKIGVTVSGLNKKQGAEELAKKGGLEYFRDEEVFVNSGRTCSYFNNMKPYTMTVDGAKFTNASNIAIVDVTYTLGMSDMMKSILLEIEKRSDNNE